MVVHQKLKKLHQQVEQYLQEESSGHDIYHAQRVFKSALYIQSHEGGDEYVIGAAALVHDICRPWEKKTGKSHFGPEALQIIRHVLTQSQVKLDSVEPILEVVKFHDIYDWTDRPSQKSIELQIVQDADNLDAIGAIGIARTFAFGGAHGSVMYHPGENLDFKKNFVEDPHHKTSTIAHFYEKLLKLKDHMNTRTGERLAYSRHQVMVDFLDQFFSEWEGMFSQIATELGIKVAPVGLAWERSLQERPALDLYETDRNHSNARGTYLAACVLYATIFGQNPSGLDYQPADLLEGTDLEWKRDQWQMTEDEVAFLQRIAWETVVDYQAQR